MTHDWTAFNICCLTTVQRCLDLLAPWKIAGSFLFLFCFTVQRLLGRYSEFSFFCHFRLLFHWSMYLLFSLFYYSCEMFLYRGWAVFNIVKRRRCRLQFVQQIYFPTLNMSWPIFNCNVQHSTLFNICRNMYHNTGLMFRATFSQQNCDLNARKKMACAILLA